MEIIRVLNLVILKELINQHMAGEIILTLDFLMDQILMEMLH